MPQIPIQNSLESHSLLYRVIRIYPHEFSRVLILWLFRFLYRFALVLAWTFIVAYFVNHFGHELLPYLFLVHAFLIISGSMLFIRLSYRYSLEILFLGTIFLASLLLLFSKFALDGSFLSITVVFFVEAFTLVQLSINFDTFVERLFTPLESERTFAVVESADTIAALSAGSLLFFGSEYLGFFHLLWILIGLLFALIPLLLVYQNFIHVTPGMCMYRKQLMEDFQPEENSFLKTYRTAHKYQFARALIVIVFLQWVISLFLEFLFTVSVSREALEISSSLPTTTSGIENILIHEFGFLYIFLGAAAFLSQIFLAPRVIAGLGIVSSMILHPLMYLLNMIGLVGSFGFFTTFLAKVNSEVTGSIYRNAYQASYYVFEEEESQHMRLFFEGIVRPGGILFATFYLLFGRLFVPERFFILSAIFGMFVAVFIFLFYSFRLQKHYLQTAVSQLFSPEVSENLKLHLIEIIQQKGNEDAKQIFYKLLSDPNTSHILRIKILESLKNDFEALPFLFEFIQHDDHETRFFALSLLNSFVAAGAFSSERYFSRQAAIATLKSRYFNESHREIRGLTLDILAMIGGKEISDFFLEILENASGDDLSDIIFSCRYFQDEGIFSFLNKFLSFDDPRVWSSVAIVFSGSKIFDQSLRDSIFSFLKSSKPFHYLAGLRVARHLKDRGFLEFLQKRTAEFSLSSDEYFFTVLTLAVLGDLNSLRLYVNFLLDEDSLFSEKGMHFLSQFPDKFRKYIESWIHKTISQRLHLFLQNHPFKSWDEISVEFLKKLRMMYFLLNASEEIIHIDHLLKKRDPAYHPFLLYT